MEDDTSATLEDIVFPLGCGISEEDETTIRNNATSSGERERRRLEQKNRRALAIDRRNARLSNRPDESCFVGRHKWLGGAVDTDGDGTIYGIPSHAIEMVCIHPDDSDNSNIDATVSTIRLPNEYKEGHFKWLRGIIVNGYVYGIPAWSRHGVLKVRVERHGRGPRVRVLPLPSSVNCDNNDDETNDNNTNNNDTSHDTVRRDRWMWHGAGLSRPHHAIYCIPSNAKRVLKIDVTTDAVMEIGPTFAEGQNKWYGGILGKDGCIYGIPYTASGVLRIDPKTDDVQLLGSFPVGGWKWHGGLLAPYNHTIYAFPAHANEVLCIDTNLCSSSKNENDQQWRVSTMPIQKHAQNIDPDDLQYKWLGGAHGADGCVYGMPSDSTTVLRIDPATNTAITFGDVALHYNNDNGNNHSSSSNILNKWQGGVLCPKDHCVYAVPANANCVLKIDTKPSDTNSTTGSISFLSLPNLSDCPEEQRHHDLVEDKWQGGFLAKNGIIYGIPENFSRIMKLTPGADAKVEYLL